MEATTSDTVAQPSEEIDYDSLSADELYEKGKEFFKVDRNYAEAAECFSRCLEKRSGDNPYDSSLRECYLWFADSLLTKEEENQSMFADTVDASTEEHLPSADAVLEKAEQKEASDETLAFETFQIAYQCYTEFLSGMQGDHPEIEKEVLDASYCLMRLGDMYFTNHQFEEAAKEFDRALQLRHKYKLKEKHFASLYVSLAQCQMFNGQLGESLRTFTSAKEIINRILLVGTDEEERKRLQDTLEDIGLQMDDLRKLIASLSAHSAQKGSQVNAAALIPQTTDSFDEKKLDTATKSAFISVEQNSTGEKRRIDISGMYK
ncbi:hypothetical protein BgAZ_404040 [Babesia gibsoni]|uniref:Tetratricopeptide SHNi-TPR domain-containing protein n=1 Tax=Babesia gibsoni TaxID=33632 RepID=A0AAD8LK90_BABGI|nr:hypothetical protein BgAZ_404040 [Babesia gibsoni]